MDDVARLNHHRRFRARVEFTCSNGLRAALDYMGLANRRGRQFQSSQGSRGAAGGADG
jgi:hypothetical protein